MKKIILSFIFLFFASVAFAKQTYEIGVCIMATGKYAQFAENFISSARKHFCNSHRVKYFVFTDQLITPANDIVRIEQKRLGWPYDTLMRFHIYYNNRHHMKNCDFIYAIDADMQFISDVENEVLTDRVAVQHFGFVGLRGTYETRKKTMARVSSREGSIYYCGGVYGGRKKEFIKLCKTIRKNIDIDLSRNYIARWHDESHLNRYFIDHPPTTTLTPSYCYPENWSLPFEKKLLALDKNHQEMRL